MNRITRFGFPFLVLSASFLLAACGGDDDGAVVQPPTPTPTVVTMFASLDNTQETPSTPSTARGFGILTLDTATNRVTGFIVHNVSNTISAHVHGPAARQASANPVVTMVQAGPGLWVTQDNATLPAANVADFSNGLLYYNVHSQTFQAGEIRGQIDRKATAIQFASLDNTQETPSTPSTARGFGILAFDPATNGVAGAILHNVADTISAHVHGPAARQASANPVVTMVQAGPGLWVTQDNATLPAANVADFSNGLLYYNVHSQTFQAGEIRGQIDLP